MSLSQEKINKYKTGALNGIAGDQCNLGVMYKLGDGVEQSSEKALEWFFKSAEQKYPRAYWHIASAYAEGLGVSFNAQKALDNFILGAELGYGPCSSMAGRIYNGGLGITKDLEKAKYWYENAIKHKEITSMYQLGIMYEDVNWEEANPEIAFAWFLKAAENNFTNAFFKVAHMYRTGEGVKKNINNCILWLEKGAEIKALAGMQLALIYRTGDGVPKDDAKADLWVEKATKLALIEVNEIC